MDSQDKITGAEYAKRLLAVDSPTRNIDHLIEHLSSRTGAGHESNLLEFKGCYHKSPGSSDPSTPDEFEWNVMHAFIALANAQGGCVVIGLIETDDRQLKPGDWDPDEILSQVGPDGTRVHKPSKEEKDLINHVTKIFFGDKLQKEGRTYKFAKGGAQSQQDQHEYKLEPETVKKLAESTKFYPCHSETYRCPVLAAIVQPVPKDGDLHAVTRTAKRKSEQVVYYRDDTLAHTKELTTYRDIKQYEKSREPASSDYLRELRSPQTKQLPKVESIYSTVPKPDSFFHGRCTELTRIEQILGEGKIPLIQAPGGTGKTQLVFQYAKLHAKNYPGGCLYIPMETAIDWDAALQLLIQQVSSHNTQSVQEWLGISQASKSKSWKGQGTRKEGAAIDRALCKNALHRGRTLLVLDNIEDPNVFLRSEAFKKLFPTGRPEGLHIIGTARTRERMTPQRAPDVEILKLDDFPEADALKLLLPDGQTLSPSERTAAQKIIQILGGRALYLRRVARLIDDDIADGLHTPVSNTLRRLEESQVDTLKDPDDRRTPDVLWRWLKEQLAKNERDGDKTIRLAQVLSLFPADGISSSVLEALWYADFGVLKGREILKAWDDSSFKHALQILIRYGLVYLNEDTNLLSMHRLDQDAVQKNYRADVPNCVNELVEALNDCPCFSPSSWVSLAEAKSPLMAACPWTELNASERHHLLVINPEWISKIPDWDTIPALAWTDILNRDAQRAADPACDFSFVNPSIVGEHPELIDHFNKDDLSGYIWSRLLIHDPKFADDCPWARLGQTDWMQILYHHPEMIQYCPKCDIFYGADDCFERERNLFNKAITDQDIRTMVTLSWGKVFKKYPSLAPKFDWEKFSEATIFSLLIEVPELCQSHGIKSPPLSAKPDHIGWNDLIAARPEFLDEYRIRFKNLVKLDWKRILDLNQDLRSLCPPTELKKYDQVKEENPDTIVFGELWRGLQLSNLQEFDWSKMDNVPFAELVSRYPGLAILYPFEFKSRLQQPEVRKYLLEERPSLLGKKCGFPTLLTQFDFSRGRPLPSEFGRDKSEAVYTQNREVSTNRQKLTFDYGKFGQNLETILKREREDPGSVLPHLSTDELALVLCFRPDLIGRLGGHCTQLTSEAWKFILQNRPSLKSYCDWSQFSGRDMCELILDNPEFAVFCDKEKVDAFLLHPLDPRFPPDLHILEESPTRLDKDKKSYLLANYPQLKFIEGIDDSTLAPPTDKKM